MLFSTPFYRWENWGLAGLSNLWGKKRHTQEVNGKTRSQTGLSGSKHQLPFAVPLTVSPQTAHSHPPTKSYQILLLFLLGFKWSCGLSLTTISSHSPTLSFYPNTMWAALASVQTGTSPSKYALPLCSQVIPQSVYPCLETSHIFIHFCPLSLSTINCINSTPIHFFIFFSPIFLTKWY